MKLLLWGLVMLGLLGCGIFEDDEEKSSNEPTCSFGELGCGKAFVGGSGTVDIDLSDVEGTYVISPYATGSTSTVSGGVSGQNLVFSSSSFLTGSNLRAPISVENLSPDESEERRKNLIHLLMTRLTERSYNTPEYQKLLSEYEALNLGLTSSSFRSLAENALERQRESRQRSRTNLTTSTCSLTEFDLVYDVVSVVAQSTSGDNYCIYVEDGETLDTASIASVIETIISNYKTIFDDELAASGSFNFKPNFVFADYSGTDVETSVGFFDSSASEAANAPVFVLPVNGSRSDQNQAGTIAHELLHGIEYYYKVKRNSVDPEPSGLAEGLAHFFQDVFGDGSYNFSGYVNGFVSSWTQSVNGTVALPANGSTDTYRGAAASFIYYLASRNGNFSETTGYVTGSGVSYIANYIKSSNTGTRGLNSLLGGNLVEVFGEYGAALVVGGSSAEPSDARFQFDESFDISDPFGGAGVFGFTPNDSRGNGDKILSYSDWYDPASGVSFEMPYYTFKPVTVSGGSSYSFELADEGLGGFAVRVE